jgi:hypothetical protein
MGFMVLTNSGHIAIAKAIHDKTLFLAWGDLPPFIEAPADVVPSVIVDGSSLLNIGIYEYVVTSLNEFGETDPTAVIQTSITSVGHAIKLDWTSVVGATGYKIYGRVNGITKYLTTITTNTFTDNGSINPGVANPPTANTTSAEAWGQDPLNPNVLHSRLYREVGRRKILTKKYVVPDPEGPYATTQSRWSESSIPTRHLYVYVAFDLDDASTSTLFQYGLFIDTVAISGYENANYLTPDLVDDPGTMLSIENTSPIFRNRSTREIHEIVMTF